MFHQVCYQRLQAVAYLRDMLRPPHLVRCFRFGVWRAVSSQALLPGDLVSLAAAPGGSAADHMVPCDLLVLRGSCIANEAMLTGESVPQRKDAATQAAAPAATPLSLEDGPAGSGPHKRHVVFAGTQVLQHDAGSSGGGQGSSESGGLGGGESGGESESSSGGYGAGAGAGVEPLLLPGVPRAPDGGCVCVVLRTGYGSAQGTLMRTVLFAAERVTANSAETAGFIAVLMVFAVAAAGYVLRAGLADERRNQFKLWLHCVMIVTSVVRPAGAAEKCIYTSACFDTPIQGVPGFGSLI